MKLQKLIDAVKDAQESYHKLTDTGSHKDVQAESRKVKDAQAALAAAITAGALPCPSCGKHPHGMEQRWDIDKQEIIGFEIGCLDCPDHCAVGYFAPDVEARLKLCLESWNAGPSKWWKDKRFSFELREGVVVLRDKNQPSGWCSCKPDLPTREQLAKLPEDERETAYHRLRREALAVRDARVAAWRKQGDKPAPAAAPETVA